MKRAAVVVAAALMAVSAFADGGGTIGSGTRSEDGGGTIGSGTRSGYLGSGNMVAFGGFHGSGTRSGNVTSNDGGYLGSGNIASEDDGGVVGSGGGKDGGMLGSGTRTEDSGYFGSGHSYAGVYRIFDGLEWSRVIVVANEYGTIIFDQIP